MTIPIDFKKYLISSLRSTRWGELIEAFQSVMGEVDDDLVEKMLDRFDLDEGTEDDFKYLLTGFGWTYSTYSGWTSELEYFKRQAMTCVDRIFYKNTRRAYLNEYYIFHLTGDVYPLKEEADDSLTPFSGWWTNSEIDEETTQMLDAELPNILYYISGVPYYDDPIYSGSYPTFLDTGSISNPPTYGYLEILDGYTELESITRFIVLQYKFNKVEDSTYFLSTNSMKAFYNDILKIKRITEQIYFEPVLQLPYNTGGTLTTTSYDNLVSGDSGGTMYCIMIADSFSDLTTINIGSGSHSTIDGTITDVQTLVYTISSDYIVADEDNPTTEFRKLLSEQDQFYDFSEVAFFDSGGTCFFYATFPMVKYYYGARCYSNIKFKFVPST